MQPWQAEVQRKQHGDLIALLSADGREVEILEVLMQARNFEESVNQGSYHKSIWTRIDWHILHIYIYTTYSAWRVQVYTPPPSSDPFSNFKLPVMACAVVLLLGWVGWPRAFLSDDGILVLPRFVYACAASLVGAPLFTVGMAILCRYFISCHEGPVWQCSR